MRRWWGWREEVFSLKARALCRLGWHNAGCPGKPSPHPRAPRLHRDRFTEWPSPKKATQ